MAVAAGEFVFGDGLDRPPVGQAGEVVGPALGIEPQRLLSQPAGFFLQLLHPAQEQPPFLDQRVMQARAQAHQPALDRGEPAAPGRPASGGGQVGQEQVVPAG